MHIRYWLLVILISVNSIAQASLAHPEWKNGDKHCPIASFNDHYIEVPVFHPLQSEAHLERIPGLNVFTDLQKQFDGMNLSIYYQLYNGWDAKKKLLIMIPGGPGQPSADMGPLIDLYGSKTKLLEQFNVIVMDHRGLGCSRPVFPGNEPVESLTMREAASDIDWIRRELVGSDGPIAVWGYSYGSLLAETYALLYPDHLSRLFLGGVVAGARDFHFGAVQFESLVFSAVDPAKRAQLITVLDGDPDLKTGFFHWAFAELYTYQGRVAEIPRQVDSILVAFKDGNLAALKKTLPMNFDIMPWMQRSLACFEIFPYDHTLPGESAMWSDMMGSCSEFKGKSEYFDYTRLLTQIQVPTMVYAGAFDQVTPSNVAVRIAQQIPGSFVFIDKYLGHGFRGKIDCFLQLTDAFLRGLDRPELENMTFSPVCQTAPTLDPAGKAQITVPTLAP